MRRLLSLMAVAVAVMVVVAPAILAQQPAPQQPAPAQTERTFEGELSKVDANAKTLSVKGTGTTEMVFAYTEQTRVLGPEKTIQGLATKAGTPLKVTYRTEAGKNMATQIEQVERK